MTGRIARVGSGILYENETNSRTRLPSKYVWEPETMWPALSSTCSSWGCSFCFHDPFSHTPKNVEKVGSYTCRCKLWCSKVRWPVSIGFLLWHVYHMQHMRAPTVGRTAELRSCEAFAWCLVPMLSMAVRRALCRRILSLLALTLISFDHILIIYSTFISTSSAQITWRQWQLCIHRRRSGFKHKKWTATRRCEKSQCKGQTVTHRHIWLRHSRCRGEA